jgi:hypothetical protein
LKNLRKDSETIENLFPEKILNPRLFHGGSQKIEGTHLIVAFNFLTRKPRGEIFSPRDKYYQYHDLNHPCEFQSLVGIRESLPYIYQYSEKQRPLFEFSPRFIAPGDSEQRRILQERILGKIIALQSRAKPATHSSRYNGKSRISADRHLYRDDRK